MLLRSPYRLWAKFADVAWQMTRQRDAREEARLSYGRSRHLNIVFMFLIESGRPYQTAIAAHTTDEEDGFSEQPKSTVQ